MDAGIPCSHLANDTHRQIDRHTARNDRQASLYAPAIGRGRTNLYVICLFLCNETPLCKSPNLLTSVRHSVFSRSSRSSDSEYLASAVTASTGPFSVWCLIALYSMNSGLLTCVLRYGYMHNESQFVSNFSTTDSVLQRSQNSQLKSDTLQSNLAEKWYLPGCSGYAEIYQKSPFFNISVFFR